MSDNKELTPEEEFEKAFTEATAESNEDSEEALEPQESQDPESTEEVPQHPTEDQSTSAPEDYQDSGEGEEESEGGEETDYKALYEKEVQRTKSWEGRIKAANERAKAAEEALKTRSTLEDKSETTPAEEAVEDDPELAALFEEIPELEKPFKSLVEKRGAEIAQKIVKAEIEKLRPTFEKVETFTRQTETEAHFLQIEKAHPDYRKYVDNGALNAFIESQPSFVRSRMQEITTSGTAEEVIELFDTFKQSNSKRKAGSTSQKADALAAVPGAPGGPPAGSPDKNDFDAAWKDAISR